MEWGDRAQSRAKEAADLGRMDRGLDEGEEKMLVELVMTWRDPGVRVACPAHLPREGIRARAVELVAGVLVARAEARVNPHVDPTPREQRHAASVPVVARGGGVAAQCSVATVMGDRQTGRRG